jgi:hypothetical protein
MESRLSTVCRWMHEGIANATILDKIMHEWRVARRTAQDYVQRCRDRIKDDAAREARMVQLRLSQEQRNLLYQALANELMKPNWEPERLRVLTAAINAACRLLDGRDKAARELHKELGFIKEDEKGKKGQAAQSTLSASNLREYRQQQRESAKEGREVMNKLNQLRTDQAAPPAGDRAAELIPDKIRNSHFYRVQQEATDPEFLARLGRALKWQPTKDEVFLMLANYRADEAQFRANAAPATVALMDELIARIEAQFKKGQEIDRNPQPANEM